MRFKKRVHETRIGASPLNNLHLLMHLLLKVLVERQYLSPPRFRVYIMLNNLNHGTDNIICYKSC
jgi:hypothetical protein